MMNESGLAIKNEELSFLRAELIKKSNENNEYLDVNQDVDATLLYFLEKEMPESEEELKAFIVEIKYFLKEYFNWNY